ncbi:MAG: hypothetical protein CMJ65_12730 [Planctomycetaceae bacterium]|nr:hypothetical protein [Planctomycetaceae bacterium]
MAGKPLSNWLMFLAALVVSASGLSAAAAEPSVDFLRDVRPILKAHCFVCHGAGNQEGGLRLDRKPQAIKGGDNGPVIVPRKSAASLLVQLVNGKGPEGTRMPPKDGGRPLRANEVAVLRSWIDRGAAWPDGIDDTADRLSLWSLRPIAHPAVPPVKDSEWGQNPIDAFILAQLEERRMRPSPRARPRHLVRRAWIDLLGLPPDPSDVDAFVDDDSPGAFARVVDRLLANPHYGERWGRHWLDLVRYADTNGYEVDGVKPLAWKYRDWVVRSLNADLPYDRFVVEQLAGDELPDANTDTILATGFYRVGPWDAERGASVQPSEVVEELYNELDDMVSTTSQVFLGLTMGCARCHDHKFDPLTTRDYYSMVAIVRGLKREHKGRTELSRAAVPPAQLAGKDPKTLPQGYFFFESSPTPPGTRVLRRGNPAQPGIEVPAAVPASLVETQPTFESADKFTSRRRISLARWIMSEDNPLPRRVIVNRIWQYHFGSGLVRSANDFGVRGSLPSHPELLDWLATWFGDEAGYSIKQLHRLIMTSRTYATSKRAIPANRQRDVDNLLLSHFPTRRLEVEAIRDVMLAVSGRFNDRLYGPPMYPYIPRDALRSGYNPAGVWQPFNEIDASRRTVYSFLKRTLVVPFLETLDFCDTARSAERREVTTVAPQALELFNGEFVNRQAGHFADRLIAEVGDDSGAQLRRGFRLALGRVPTADERSSLLEFLEEQSGYVLAEDRRRFGLDRKQKVSGEVVRDGLTLWLDASRGVVAGPDGTIKGWESRVGKLRANSAGDPQIIAKGIGGRAAVEFDADGDWFQLSGPVVTGQQFTMIAVVTDRATGAAGSRNLIGNWDGGKGNSTSSLFLGTSTAANNARRVRFSDAYAPADKLVLSKPATAFSLTGVSGKNDARVYQNGRELGRQGGPLATRRLDTAWTIGRQGTLAGEYWNGLVAEVLVWNRELSPVDLSSVWRHLSAKYDLPDAQAPPEPLTLAQARRLALVQVCRVLLNLNEFVYTD